MENAVKSRLQSLQFAEAQVYKNIRWRRIEVASKAKGKKQKGVKR